MELSSQQISEILPHRYPFLLVDRALDLRPGESCRALKNVSVNEPFFPGHFPGQPIMPGVLILESMAQAGALILLSMEEHQGKTLYFAGAEEVKFKRPVVPGDTLIHDITLIFFRRGMGKIQCRCTVGQDVAAEAVIAFALSKSP
jgi:3-hydroxyacyl-[acyl-carrier-protein] dehydratase